MTFNIEEVREVLIETQQQHKIMRKSRKVRSTQKLSKKKFEHKSLKESHYWIQRGFLVKNQPAGRPGLDPEEDSRLGGGHGATHCSICLGESPRTEEPVFWRVVTVHGITKSQTRLSKHSTAHCIQRGWTSLWSSVKNPPANTGDTGFWSLVREDSTAGANWAGASQLYPMPRACAWQLRGHCNESPRQCN